MLAYGKGYSGSKELLEEGIQASEQIRAGMIDFASAHLLDKNTEISQKSIRIFRKFLNEDTEDISRMYDSIFHKYKPYEFNELYELIDEYSKSKIIQKEAHFFFEYLGRCVSIAPEKCIDLIQNYVDVESVIQIERSIYQYRGAHIEILIEAYNKLIANEAYQDKAIALFDTILKNEIYQRECFRILDEYDRA
jgi:hypothetical protein